MSQSVEIPMASRIVVTLAFALVISGACTRTSGLAAAAGFNDLPDDQKAAALELLNSAMLETGGDPIQLIKMGMDKAKEGKSLLTEQDNHQDAHPDSTSSHDGKSVETDDELSMVRTPEIPMVGSTFGESSRDLQDDTHDDESVFSSDSTPAPQSMEPRSTLTHDDGDDTPEVDQEELISSTPNSLSNLKSSSPVDRVDSRSESGEHVISADEADPMAPLESVLSRSVSSYSGSEHHSETSGPTNHEDYNEVHMSSAASSDPSHHDHYEKVHLTKEVSSDPLHHHEQVHVSSSSGLSPGDDHHEEVHISTSGPNFHEEKHISSGPNFHEEKHISSGPNFHEEEHIASGPQGQSSSSSSSTSSLPASSAPSSSSYVRDSSGLPKEEVFVDTYIDRSNPSDPKEVHIEKKQKTDVDPNGYSHENHESKTTTSLNNPNNYRQQETSASSSYSSHLKNNNRHRNRNNQSSYKTRRPSYSRMSSIKPYPTIPPMPPMPPMMPLMPFALHPGASAWTGLYGSDYDDALGAYASASGAYASAYAGIPSYYAGYPNYGVQAGARARRGARRRRNRNQQAGARRVRYQPNY